MAYFWPAKKESPAGAAAAPATPTLDYYLVLDFEATCENQKHIKPQEIIEFPVLKVNARTLETEAEFHAYVRPTVHAQLTPFCTQLTGITQDMVDGKPVLQDVMSSFQGWMETNGLLEPSVKSCFVTCGDWDLKKMLPSQCEYFRLPIPYYFRSWINVKQLFSAVTGERANGMPSMLHFFGLSLDGRHHSGIDDSRNIAKILVSLARQKPDIRPTTTLPPFKLES